MLELAGYQALVPACDSRFRSGGVDGLTSAGRHPALQRSWSEQGAYGVRPGTFGLSKA
jgi:hypothetical protein